MTMFSFLKRWFNTTSNPMRNDACQVLPPYGYVQMINKKRLSKSKQSLRPTFNLINDLAFKINKHHSHLAHHEKIERWCENSVSQRQPSDCEDFALYMRKCLFQRGISEKYVHLATCYVGREYHAVLLVNTKQGWYVYDVLNKGVIYGAGHYNFEKIELRRNFWIEG